MFTQQARGNGPPGMPMQPHGGLAQCQSDIQAKEKLTTLIYEYLTLAGATKTAETFKEEIINNNPAFANFKPQEKGSSFLLDWWLIFWDLYCAAPERRDLGDGGAYTQDAKYFHDYLIQPMHPPQMNGHFGPPMGMTPEIMGGHHFSGGRFAHNRMPPGTMPPAGFPMFPDPRMGRMPANSMRMPPGGGFPVPGAMRPGAGGPPMSEEFVGMPRYDFMGGPGQAFAGGPSGSGMMPNGTGIPGISMASPVMPPPGADPLTGLPTFMGMPPGPMPASSSAMPFGLSDQVLPPSSTANPLVAPSIQPPASAENVSNVAGMPGSVPGMPGSVPGMPGSVPGMPGSVPGMPTSVGAPTSLINGEDIKTSPASTPRGGTGATGGTPAPGSVQSAANQQPSTPSGPLSQQPLSAGPPPAAVAPEANANDFKKDTEITKIREGLLDGFKTEETDQAFYT